MRPRRDGDDGGKGALLLVGIGAIVDMIQDQSEEVEEERDGRRASLVDSRTVNVDSLPDLCFPAHNHGRCATSAERISRYGVRVRGSAHACCGVSRLAAYLGLADCSIARPSPYTGMSFFADRS